MHRIDATGATAGNLFTDGDEVAGIPKTSVDYHWHNAVQGELVTLVEQSGQALDKPNNGQLKDALLGMVAHHFDVPNYALNGGFRFWQRALSATITAASGVFYAAADRYRFNPGLGSNSPSVDVSRQDHPDHFLDIPQANDHFCRCDFTAPGDSTGPSIDLRLEGVQEWQARPLCWSVWLRVASGTVQVTPEVFQFMGSGGGQSTTTPGGPWTITTTWQRFVFKTTPPVIGVTVGTFPRTDYRLTFAAGLAPFVLEMDNFQVVPGVAPIPFRHLPVETELKFLQRYYCKSYDLDTPPGTVTDAGALFAHESGGTSIQSFQGMLPTRMYVGSGGPFTTWYSPTTGAINKVRWDIATDRDVSTTLQENECMRGFPDCTASPGSGEFQGKAHFIVEAELGP